MRKTRHLAALSVCAALHGCGGGGGDSSGLGSGSSGASEGGANAAPSISGTPPRLIHEEGPYTFTPIATDADDDALSFSIENAPAWAAFDPGSGRLSGTPRAADVGVHEEVRIRVSDGIAQVALPAFDIEVEPVSHGSFTLSWQPPTENVDDTPLQNLDGFNIYWGDSPGEYTDRLTLDNEGLTAYFFEGLDAGTHYFAVTAFNRLGVESEVSDHAVIVVR